MANIIKTTLEQISVLADRKTLIKTRSNGQWELLTKGDDNTTPGKVPTSPVSSSPHIASNKKFAELFGNLNHHIKEAKAGKTSYVNGARGAIKSYALSLPKGQIDLGNLGKLREAHDKIAPTGNPRARRRPITKDDMAEIINHHVGDAPSLKHIHDNNGGEHAIATLARTMGANGDPQEYSAFKFKNPQLHTDLLDLVNPGKHKYEVKAISSTYENTHADEPFELDVIEANHDLMADQPDGSAGYDNDHIRKQLTNAAAKRAVHRFKKHHGIP